LSFIILVDRDQVRRHLTLERCIPAVRSAMIALAAGQTSQVLRQIIRLDQDRSFGAMQGSLGKNAMFGAKVISVYPGNFGRGLQSHQGLVTLFDPESGAPVCLLHAGEVTRIRTAAASAVATAALARPAASRLAVLGYGEQAHMHVEAMIRVRPISIVRVWGRSFERSQQFARSLRENLGITAEALRDVTDAVHDADVICTTTGASEPILESRMVADGCHINVVGSSHAGPAEINSALVKRARFFPDHRASVLQQGGEFLRAKAAGLVADDHVLADIGAVLSGEQPGRRTADEVTIYKSLGNIVQDLASAAVLYGIAQEDESWPRFAI
jgi:ornithine cyclodeaminase/alanine dehydrogenase-like protein (mu-crystallin family)